MKLLVPFVIFIFTSALVLLSGCGGVAYQVHNVKDWEGPAKFKTVSMKKGKSKLFIEEKKGVFLQEYSIGLISSNPKVASVDYREFKDSMQVYVKARSKGSAYIYYIKREPGVFGYKNPNEMDVRKLAKKSPRFKIIVK